MGATEYAISILVGLLGYLVAPVMLIWGWIRWCGRQKQKTIASILSFTGLVLATASAALGLCTILFARSGFLALREDVLLRRAVQLGAVLSLAGILFSLAGIWRTSATRWQAPASALGTLAFWFIVAFFAVES